MFDDATETDFAESAARVMARARRSHSRQTSLTTADWDA